MVVAHRTKYVHIFAAKTEQRKNEHEAHRENFFERVPYIHEYP